jgi:hypothetical protein
MKAPLKPETTPPLPTPALRTGENQHEIYDNSSRRQFSFFIPSFRQMPGLLQ